MSGKKSVLLGCPFVPFLACCPRFIPTLTNCSYMLMHQWPKISSDFLSIYIKSLAAGVCPRPCWGRPQCSQTSKLDPDSKHLWHFAPTTRACGARPGLRCPNYSNFTLIGNITKCRSPKNCKIWGFLAV